MFMIHHIIILLELFPDFDNRKKTSWLMGYLLNIKTLLTAKNNIVIFLLF